MRSIDQIRIDIPLRTGHAFLFVNPKHPGWDPWWRVLYDFLLGFACTALEWTFEPSQEKSFARPPRAPAEKVGIIESLRAAPDTEIDTHKTLARAVKLMPDEAQG